MVSVQPITKQSTEPVLGHGPGVEDCCFKVLQLSRLNSALDIWTVTHETKKKDSEITKKQ